MSYTKYFGVTKFTSIHLGDVLVPDLTKFFTIPSRFKKDPRYYLTYKLKDGDLFNLIAKRMYDNEALWWLIPFANDIVDYNEQLPLDQYEFDAMLKSKYPFHDVDTVHHFETINGSVVDPLALSIKHGIPIENVPTRFNLTPVTIYDHEYNLNEAKREIKVIDPDALPNLLEELQGLFKGDFIT